MLRIIFALLCLVSPAVAAEPSLPFFSAPASDAPTESKVSLTDSLKIAAANQIISSAEKNWFNKNGWIRLNPKASDTDNGYDNENPLLFTAEYLWLASRLGLLSGEFRETYFNRLKKQIGEMELQPGLYDRYPITDRPKDVRTFSM